MRRRPRDVAATTLRLLDLVVQGSDEFFGRLASKNWSCASRMLPLSVRIPVLAGIAAVSSRPDYWIGKLVSAAALPRGTSLRKCPEILAFSDAVELPRSRSVDSRYCRNVRNLGRRNSVDKWQQHLERAPFR
jgi:hypothetical protein